jgi:hypothetical protein
MSSFINHYDPAPSTRRTRLYGMLAEVHTHTDANSSEDDNDGEPEADPAFSSGGAGMFYCNLCVLLSARKLVTVRIGNHNSFSPSLGVMCDTRCCCLDSVNFLLLFA